MAELKQLLELRNKIKEKKPDFIRQDYQRRKRLARKLKWKKPKGIHSKIRHHFKGRRKMPSPGYKSPLRVRGLSTFGLKIVRVASVAELQKMQKNEGAIIPKSVGMKKRLEILKKAREINAAVLNFNVSEAIAKIETAIASKRKEQPKAQKKESSKEKEAKEILSDEQKKEFEKMEKDKLLTKKV